MMQNNDSNQPKPAIQKFVPHKSLQQIKEFENPNATFVEFSGEPTVAPNQMQLMPNHTPTHHITASATQTAFLQARVNQARRARPPEPNITVDDDPVSATAQIQARIDAQKKK